MSDVRCSAALVQPLNNGEAAPRRDTQTTGGVDRQFGQAAWTQTTGSLDNWRGHSETGGVDRCLGRQFGQVVGRAINCAR